MTRAPEHVLLDAKPACHIAHGFDKFRRQHLGLPALLGVALLIRCAGMSWCNARDFERILEGEEHAFGSAFVRRQRQKVFAV